MLNLLKKMFTGRMGREEFLLPGLFLVVLPISVAVSSFLLAGVDMEPTMPISVSSLISLLFVVPVVKRLHDIGLSGWFSLILFSTLASILYSLLFLLEASLYDAIQYYYYLLLSSLAISFLINILSILFLLLKRGNEKNNKYGTKPKFFFYSSSYQEVFR